MSLPPNPWGMSPMKRSTQRQVVVTQGMMDRASENALGIGHLPDVPFGSVEEMLLEDTGPWFRAATKYLVEVRADADPEHREHWRDLDYRFIRSDKAFARAFRDDFVFYKKE